jgi:uncharacterized protein (DUF608 family)
MPDQNTHVTRRGFVASAAGLAATVAMGAAAGDDPHPATQPNAALRRKLTTGVSANPTWPILTKYDEEHLARIAMPLGGIGTGTISLGGRGDLRDWELVNKPAKGYSPPNTFFALYCKPEREEAVSTAIEGPLDVSLYEGASGSVAHNHGLPRFRRCNFACAYPLAQVLLSDPNIPLQVRLEAFNPFVPIDTDASGIPAAVLRFVLINPAQHPVQASICGTIENFIGWDGDHGKVSRNFNEFRSKPSWPVRGLLMQSAGLDRNSPAWGNLTLATTSTDVTYRTAWADASWGNTLLDFWDDFSADGQLDPRDGKREAPFGSLAASTVVPAMGSSSVTFLITWHFPNRVAWNPPFQRVGNYYTSQYADSWDAAVRTAADLKSLEDRTVQFVQAVVQSDLPDIMKEAALYNASTLRTQTSFRTEDGRFFGWEGCNDHGGCCDGSCTHVWNYDQTTPFLFGSLARSMRDIEFGQATDERGLMSFRVHLPLADKAQETRTAAADGQMGTVMKLYREWRLSGDDAMLTRLWPGAKRALAFAWIPGGWDADRDGVMEGCQHNTMDVEYYGPNPEIGVWYLGALHAAAAMAEHLGEKDFAAVCRDLFTRGSKWVDANLFNGEYYEQQIRPVQDASSIAPGLRLGSGAANPAEPELQIGSGCLADQLVGQLMADVCGLGPLLDPTNIAKTLASVMRYNFLESFWGHFNHLRSYALGDEAGLLVASYPKGNMPKSPFPYCSEAWTGIEYTAAAGMLRYGLQQQALRIIASVRDRFDGRKRNPFDEAECGHHYARAMAAWATVLAFTGFEYDAHSATICFRPSREKSTWVWSNGNAWGVVHQQPGDREIAVSVQVIGGQCAIQHCVLRDVGENRLDAPRTLKAGDSAQFRIPRAS